MSTVKRLVTPAAATLLLVSSVCAQGQNPASSARSTIPVTAAATADRVRFTAPSTVVQIRLEVYGANGEKLFDNEIRGGNVIDWRLQNGQAEPLSDGAYLCVITVKSLSGKITQRIASATIEKTIATLQTAVASQLTPQQSQAVGPIEDDASLILLKEGENQTTTVIAHNGENGLITRGRGALSFRIGDFFSGKDIEQMRLTAEGNLGIGITHPQARLDVDGLIRASQGIMFPDGTIQTTAAVAGDSQRTPHKTRGITLPGQTGEAQRTPGKAGKGQKEVSPEFVADEDLTVNGSIFFTTGFPRDIAMLNNTGGVRIYSAPTLTNSPASAAIQFFGTGSAFTGQAYIDSGAHDNAAVIFRTAGTGGTIAERMRITATGNVGIGTTSPAAKLDVAGAINTSTQYNIGNTRILSVAGINNTFVGVGAGNLNTGQENSYFGASAGSLNTTGNRNSLFGSQAGVVTTNGANSFFGYKAGVQNSTGGFNSFFGDSAGNQNVDGNNNTAIGYATTLGFTNLTNATAIGSRAQVDQSNSLVLGSIYGVNGAVNHTKVGIGITAPSATLHVKSFSTSLAENTATFQATNIGANPSHIHYGTNGDWYIRSAASAGKVVLQDTGGNVGIGTATPALKLDVRDGTGASFNGGHVQIGATISGADEKIIVFGDSGCGGPCVFIGEQEADDRMVLGAGSFRFKFGNVLPYSNNGQTLGSSDNKWAEVWAVNGTIQTSDARLKQGIANLKYGLSQVMQLRPVSFQWKTGNDKRTHLGLIAQEVDAVLPEAVQKGADAAAPLGMNYSDLIPVLIKAIQEQQGTLERAQAEIKTLRAENEALSRRIMGAEATSTQKAH